MSRRLLGQTVMVAAILLNANVPSFATSIVAIHTPDQVVIAADSEQTLRGGGLPTNRQTVCKIYQEGDALIAISGLAGDPARGLDPVQIVAAVLHDKNSFKKTINLIKRKLSVALRAELERLRVDDPALFSQMLEDSEKNGTAVFFTFLEYDVPVAAVIGIYPSIHERHRLALTSKRLTCPGDCPDGVYTFFLGERKAIDRYVAENGKHFSMGPDEIVRFMVQLEIDAGTPGVGPPIDVVQLDKAGIKWLSPRPGCP